MFENKPEGMRSKNKELHKILIVACVSILMIFFITISVLISNKKNQKIGNDFNSSVLNSPISDDGLNSDNLPIDDKQGYISVSLPIRIDFPHSKAKLVDIKKNFSIEPTVEGNFSFNGQELILEHEKNLKYNTEYKIIIAKNLALGEGEILTEDFTLSFTTKPRSTGNAVILHSDYGFKNYTYNYYEADYELQVSIGGRSDNYIFEVYQSDQEELYKVFSMANNREKYNEFDKMIESDKLFKGKFVDSQTINLSKGAGNYIPKISLPGIYYVKVLHKSSDSLESSFFITLTKNAVVTKRLGNKLVTWVVDQKTSSGVWGARIIASGEKEGEILFQGKTDKRGIFIWPDSAKQPDVLEVCAGGDSAFNFLNMGMGWGASIYRDGYGMNQNTVSDYKAYVYSDRPVYRPGDKINFKAIVRENSGLFYKPAQKEFKITAQEVSYGEGGDTIFEKKIFSNQKGSLADFVELSREIKSGEYRINILDGNEILAGSNFNIEFYQKPDFEISVSGDSDKYIKGEAIKGEISSNYFFGEPVKGGEVAWRAFTYDGSTVAEGDGVLGDDGKMKLEISTNNISFRSDDWYWWREDGDSITIEAKIIDKSGKESTGAKTVTVFSGDYKISLIEPKDPWSLKENETYGFVVRAEENISGKSIEGLLLKATIKKYDWRYGDNNGKILQEIDLKSDSQGEVRFDYNFPGGGNYRIEISGVDSRNNPISEIFNVWVYGKNLAEEEIATQKIQKKILISADKASYKIGEVAKVTVQFPRPSGDVFWSANRNNFKRIEVAKIIGQTQVISVPITESLAPGFYFYANIFQDDAFLSESQLIEVSGKKLTIEIVPSREKTGPGEEAEIMIKTKDENGNPVSAESSLSVVDKAIFSLKSDQTANIYDAFYQLPEKGWLKTEESNGFIMTFEAEMGGCLMAGTKILMADKSLKNIETIKIGDEILTKESDYSEKLAPDKVIKTFEHSATEYLAIRHEKGILKITSIHPVLVNDIWKDAGEIKTGDSLSMVGGEKTKVVFVEKIKTKEPIKVYNFQTEKYHTFFADGVYVHNECGGKGGDSCPARSNFVDTAYWNAFVDTDAKGEAKIKFKLPDNLTTWMAVSKAVTPDTKTGQGAGEFITTKDLIIRPVLPQFFRNGDEIVLVGAVHNNSGEKSDFKVALITEGAQIIGQNSKNISVENGGINNVSWKLKIGEKNSVKLIFSVKDTNSQANDSMEISLPVYSDLSLVKKVISGTGEAKLNFAFEKNSSAVYNTAVISLTPSVLAALPEVIEKLSGYPYGCVEQTMSRHLPNILVYKEKSVLDLDPAKDFEKNIAEGFDRLAKFQHNDGGFGWWETDENNVWMSGYVLEGLYEAKAAGLLGGREEMYDRLREYLKSNVNKFSEKEQIYINYALSKTNKESIIAGVEKFADVYLGGKKFDAQSHGYIALALQNIGDTIKAKAVLEKIIGEMEDNHWEVPDNFDYHGALKDKYSATGVNLLALIRINYNEKKASEIAQWLMNNRLGYEGLWGSTRQSAQILYALIEYLKKTAELKPNYSYDIYLNGDLLKSAKVINSRYSLKLEIPVEKIKMENYLEIKQIGKGSIYWSVAMNNFVPGEKISGEDSNLTITRKYLDIDDNEVSKINKGDLIKVRLSVANKERLKYAAIEDFLPASFVPQNPRLENSVQENDKSRYYDYPYGSEWYDSLDIRDQKITFFRTDLWPGAHNFEYLVRASYDGNFEAPAPHIEPMYSPEKFSFGSASIITVGR